LVGSEGFFRRVVWGNFGKVRGFVYRKCEGSFTGSVRVHIAGSVRVYSVGSEMNILASKDRYHLADKARDYSLSNVRIYIPGIAWVYLT
jgi:hypothetical protein